MIKNIIFDIGDVLVGYSLENFSKKNKKSLQKLEKANQILVKNEMWREYLNGNVLLKEILEKLNHDYFNYKEEFEIILEKKYQVDILVLIEENTELLMQLKEKGYSIYLLSNITKETLEVIKENYEFVKFIDGGVYSYQEHISKPNKQIYEILCTRYKLNPKECIFIDDKKKNVDISTGLGMTGIIYTNTINLKTEIQRKIGGV